MLLLGGGGRWEEALAFAAWERNRGGGGGVGMWGF